jgi:hypothetical protein
MNKKRIKNLINPKDLIKLKNNNYHKKQKKQDAKEVDQVVWLKRE